MAAPTASHAAAPVFQTPEWETRTRPNRRSLLDRLLPGHAHADSSALDVEQQSVNATKETPAPIAATAASTAPLGHGASAAPSMRQRLDSVLPPDRRYLGRSRRSFLLFILLPLAILLLLVLPLAVGLGVGLSHHDSGAQSLPLPTNSATFTGELTYYAPGLGACGVTSTDEDFIASVSHLLFDAAAEGGSNPNANQLCGRKIRIQRDFVEASKGNTSVDVTVVDRCTGCAETDLDVSLGVFTQLALEESGRVEVSWAWVS
ncbi:hypothetical protein JX265_009328 [Neoarthrinium moseri]|uniref:RlpA-like protein double-psi beta-barrel domain-containing protein n=1 Tax=Neoarthrinium moseri TaxID=1658444 RepID=A0A9P9WG30_9PEZI|nr:hypothetical protein JX266_012122 [Neoarthrinium moseri]KAI1861825.1 hypothetical protein JX265_009328 [Neoarthrinium moseri]